MSNTTNEKTSPEASCAPPSGSVSRVDLFYDDHYKGVSIYAMPGYNLAKQLEGELEAANRHVEIVRANSPFRQMAIRLADALATHLQTTGDCKGCRKLLKEFAHLNSQNSVLNERGSA